jgi:hypothetical protein
LFDSFLSCRSELQQKGAACATGYGHASFYIAGICFRHFEAVSSQREKFKRDGDTIQWQDETAQHSMSVAWLRLANCPSNSREVPEATEDISKLHVPH